MTKRTKKIAAIIVGIIILVLVFTQILAKKPTKESASSVSEKTTVKQSSLKKTVSASGKIQSNTVISLKFQTSGLLTYVGVKEGDLVKKGQLVASLDKRELEKSLKKKLNDYMTERWDFEEDRTVTYKDIALTNTIQRALDKNQFALDKTVLDVEISDIALKFANIYSPIDGIITSVDAPLAGVNVTAATATFEIADYNDIAFSINVDEADIGHVTVGQLVDIKLDAYEGESFPGVVSKIGFTSTTTSSGGTAFPVEVKFPDNSSLRFKIGMNGDADIITDTIENTLVIPSDYIFEDNNKTYVYQIDKNDNLVKKTVKTGIQTEDKTEILSGLKKGDKIAVPNQ